MKPSIAAGCARAACLAAAVLASACAVPVPGGPSVRALANGAAEVAFPDGCVVRFDGRGREAGAVPGCTRDQRARARELVDARWRQQDRVGGGWDERAPEVDMARSGAGRVVFRNGCVVDYDRDGDRLARSPACRGEQLRDADRAMAAHRRQLGLAGWNRGQPPEIVISRNGAGRVAYGNGCVVGYDRDGLRRAVGRECSDGQARHADRAMAAYRRDHGTGAPGGQPGGGPGGRPDGDTRVAPGRVSIGPDGDTEVRVDPRCTVRYDVDGQRLAAGPACDAAQLRAADRLELRFRIGHLNQQGQGD